MDYFEVRDRLRKRHGQPTREEAKVAPKAELIGDQGFLTEVGGRLILTAPASSLTVASELPVELAERWEKASHGNPFMKWIVGRYVEGEKANRNGAFWSTEDLQFGELSVTHGPLNWLHQEKTIIGTIADNAIIRPGAEKANLLETDMPRPYIAAVSAMWDWVHPEKVSMVEAASEAGKLYYSMECIAREMQCVSDETHEGCDTSFDYVKAMTDPKSVCEHMANRTSARRMVDPTFLGGAVIVPPTQPGWGSANAEMLRAAASLAEQTHEAAGDISDSQWEGLMTEVVRFATAL